MNVLRLGTRGSRLARMQSQQVADRLVAAHAGLRVDLVIVSTTGDRIVDRPLHDLGGKGLFTKELQLALLDGRIDFAVHSYKDVPVTQPLVDDAPLMIAAVPSREEVQDVLVMRGAMDVEPRRIGTGSLRRRVLCLERWPAAVVSPMRGNIDTRLAKLESGELDAVVLAAAGLRRAGLWNDATMRPLNPLDFVPSPGQGSLALECRRDDHVTRAALVSLHHAASAAATTAEREVVRLLDGDCRSPIGAYAFCEANEWQLRVAVGGDGGVLPIRRAVVTGTDLLTLAAAAVDVISSAANL